MDNTVAIEKELSQEQILRGIRRKWIPATEVIKRLEEIKNNPKSWKVAGAGGQDQYAGQPSFLRNIDEIINLLT